MRQRRSTKDKQAIVSDITPAYFRSICLYLMSVLHCLLLSSILLIFSMFAFARENMHCICMNGTLANKREHV